MISASKPRSVSSMAWRPLPQPKSKARGVGPAAAATRCRRCACGCAAVGSHGQNCLTPIANSYCVRSVLCIVHMCIILCMCAHVLGMCALYHNRMSFFFLARASSKLPEMKQHVQVNAAKLRTIKYRKIQIQLGHNRVHNNHNII